MTKGYLELVGLQVLFDKVLPEYTLLHHYRKTIVKVPQHVVRMQGYAMVRDAKTEEIVESLRKVYKPVTLSIWNQDTILTASEYLQFFEGCRPDEVGLEGEWHVVAPG